MTMDNRVTIEKGLDASLSLRNIAMQLGKDPTTIAKEIKKHRIFQEHNHYNEPKNKCVHALSCKKKNICEIYAPVCKRACRFCNRCNSLHQTGTVALHDFADTSRAYTFLENTVQLH